jgi:hypothetical protein
MTSNRGAWILVLLAVLPACAQKPRERTIGSAPSAVAACRGDGPLPPGPARTSGPLHTWGVIEYPPLATPWGLDGKARPVLGFAEKDRGLRFDLAFSGPGTDEFEKVPVPIKGDVQVVLYTPGGKVAPICGDDTVSGWAGGSLGTSGSLTFRFPWQANDLREAWIEVRLAKISYWLTVPYGFTRDPRESLCPPDPAMERPTPAPVVPEAGRKVAVIRWDRVGYDLGAIANAWRLSLLQANPFDASTAITLYKENQSPGPRGWSLDWPKTALRVDQASGHSVEGAAVSITREDDGMRRTDRFRLARNSEIRGRYWGTMVITVDGKEHSLMMPSSVFKYVHGIADEKGGRP